MSSRGTGISPDELILLETIERAKQYKAAVSEMIEINVKLEESILALKQQLGKNSNAYKKAANVVEQYAEKQRSAWAKMNAEAKKSIGVYKAKTKANIELKKSEASLAVEIEKQNIALNKLSKTNKKTGKGGFFGSLGKSGGLIAGVGLAVVGFSALKQEVTDAINLIKKLESLKFTMSKIISDDEVLDRTMGRLMMVSEDFGIELVSLTERYSNFLVAADQSGISLKDTEYIFGTVTKAMSLMGKSTDETKGSLLALEQMMSKGKITTEELRRQLGERLPGAMGLMADAIGVNIDELDRMMKKGEVISAEVLPAFAREIEKTFGIDAVQSMDTLVAAQNRSANAWTNMWRAIESGEGVAGKALKWIEEAKTAMYKALTPYDRQIDVQKHMPQGYDLSKKYLTKIAEESFKKEGRRISEVTSKEMIEREKMLAPSELVTAKKIELKSLKKIRDLEAEISDLKDDIAEIEGQSLIDTEKVKMNKEMVSLILLQTSRDKKKVIKQKKQAEKYLKHYVRVNALDIGWRQYLEDILNETEAKLGGNNDDDKTKKTGKKAIEIIDEKELRLKKYSKLLLKIMQTELDYYNKMFGESETLEDIKEWGDAIVEQEKRMEGLKYKISIDEYEVKLKKDLDKIDKKIEKIKGKIIKNENVIKNNSKIKGADVVTPAKEIADGNKAIKTLTTNKLVILSKLSSDLEANEKLHKIEMSKIQSDSLVRDLDRFRQYLEDKDSINKSKQDALRDAELASLEDTYSKGLMSAEAYERKKNEISVKYQIKKAEGELERFITLHNKMVAIGESDIDIKISSKTIEELKAKIKELELLLKQLGNQNNSFDDIIEKINEFVTTYKDAFMGMADAIHQHAIAIHQAKIDMLQEEMDANAEMYANHKELALDDAEQKRLIIREEEARRKKTQDKINKEKYEVAKKNKEHAIFTTAINTASAVINALTVVPLVPTGLALSIMAAATGAFQLATISKQKLPKYKKGTPKGGHQKDGFAIVGDGGIPEVIESKLGAFITPRTDTLVYLNKGDVVHKSINDYNVSNNNNTSPHLIEIDQNRLDKAISQGLSNAIVKNNITIINDDYNAYKLSKLDI